MNSNPPNNSTIPSYTTQITFCRSTRKTIDLLIILSGGLGFNINPKIPQTIKMIKILLEPLENDQNTIGSQMTKNIS